MTTYWYISNDFTEKRSTRIGASEIACLIPNPEKPSESLAGYDRTAVTLWQEKTGRIEHAVSGLPAEMGHWNEPKCIHKFIQGIDAEIADEYLYNRMIFELLNQRSKCDPAKYNPTPFKHNTQWYNDEFIVHPDGIYEPLCPLAPFVNAHYYDIDSGTPYLIEAKTASYWAAKRREGSLVSGFDFDLKSWQGIPLKYYVQIQFQLINLDVDVCYLPLLYDSASFHVWEIRRDITTGNRLRELASRFMWYVKNDKEPKEFAINQLDIQALYPTLNDDFTVLSGPEAEAVVKAAKEAQYAAEQEKAWKLKKEEAGDALSVYLKDNKEVRVQIGDNIEPVARWQDAGGGESISLKGLRKDDIELYNKLKDAGAITEKKAVRYPKVCLRGGE